MTIKQMQSIIEELGQDLDFSLITTFTRIYEKPEPAYPDGSFEDEDFNFTLTDADDNSRNYSESELKQLFDPHWRAILNQAIECAQELEVM